MSVRILCTGDVHLGRRPTRIPEGIDARALGPGQAWHSFVNSAVELEVDAVVLTGDVVDESNRWYEAFSLLQSGVQRLVKASIPIFAVSGNHDFDVLARLADQIPAFCLIGRGGRWEEVVLEKEAAPAVRFHGWSFPARHVVKNPLEDYPPPTDALTDDLTDDLPTVGLLHCDCDQPGSRYGPVSLAELKGKAPAAWLLGHIHKPGLLWEGLPLILYPGSLQGLDPGEQGAHGAWLITIEPGGPPRAESLPLAGLRWEQINLALDEVSDEESWGAAVIQALRAAHDRIRGEIAHTKAVGCRLYLRGRTLIHGRLPHLIAGIQADLRPAFDNVDYFIEKIEDLSRPDLSLEDIARSHDPAGLLAKRLVVLDRREPSDVYGELIRKAGRCVEKHRSSPVFASLADGSERPTDEQVRDVLIRAGLTILDRLVSQKEAGT